MEAWLMKMRNSVSVPAGESRRTFNVEGGKAEFIKLSASWDFRFIKLSGGGDSVKVPSTIGDKEKWFESNSTDHWSLFRTDLGVGWEAQGYPDSAGVGWFKKNITIPEKIDGKRLYLFFESCDEDACVWIDGQPFAEHSCASTGMWPEQIWCKPFAVDLTGKISTGQHQLTVKVYNRDGMGGIYLPVYLIVTDIPLTAEQMKKYANDHFSKFMPRLKKVTLNGKKFFNEDENVSGQNIEADPSKPVIIEYTFENVGGDCPFSVPARVFVHFNNGTTTLKGDSFYPKTPINKWEKGETYSNTTEVDLSKQKGQKLKMCLGIVIPDIKECLKMKNKMDGYPQIIIGTITVK